MSDELKNIYTCKRVSEKVFNKVKDELTEDLNELYWNQEMSQPDIANLKGCKRSKIESLMKRCGIHSRSTAEAANTKNHKNKRTIKVFKNKEEAEELYIEQEISVEDIGKLKGCSEPTVSAALKEYGIIIRDKNERVNTKRCKDLREKTCIENFGYKTALSIPEIHDKGIEAAKTKEAMNKKKATFIDKFGVSNNTKIHIKKLDIYECKPLFIDYLKNYVLENGRKPSSIDLMEFFNVNNSTINKKIKDYGCGDLIEREVSNYQIKIQDWLRDNIYDYETEFFLKDINGKFYFYDLKVGNVLIECNPNGTHLINPDRKFNSVKGNIDYHMEKTKLATDNGYTCINMFQWNLENIDNVLRFLTQENYNRIVHPIRPHIIIDLDIENPHWYPEYEPMTWYEHIKFVDMKTKWSNEYEEGLYPIYGAGYLKMKLKKPVE